MDYQSFKNAVIAACAEFGITEYELYYQSGSDTTIGFEKKHNHYIPAL